MDHIIESFLSKDKEELQVHRAKMQQVPPKSISTYIENIGHIDKNIAPLIAWLNSNGYYTLASCSGLEADHDHRCTSGYISFDYERIAPKNRETLYRKFSFLGDIKQGECYFKKSFTIQFTENDFNQLISMFPL